MASPLNLKFKLLVMAHKTLSVWPLLISQTSSYITHPLTYFLCSSHTWLLIPQTHHSLL